MDARHFFARLLRTLSRQTLVDLVGATFCATEHDHLPRLLTLQKPLEQFKLASRIDREIKLHDGLDGQFVR